MFCGFCRDEYERERPAEVRLRGRPLYRPCAGELRREYALDADAEDYVFGPGD